MHLTPDSTNETYQLGQLFSILNPIPSAANPRINIAIKGRYFSAASATPGLVFPILVNLAQKHLKNWMACCATITIMKNSWVHLLQAGVRYPVRMCPPQQEAFQLGYYHQTQAGYEKKEQK